MHVAAEQRDTSFALRRLSSVTWLAVCFAMTLLGFAVATTAVLGIRFVVFEHFHGDDWIIERFFNALFP
jgi:hypothetical protein